MEAGNAQSSTKYNTLQLQGIMGANIGAITKASLGRTCGQRRGLLDLSKYQSSSRP